MKHIKLFENFNDYFTKIDEHESNNDFYTEIDFQTWQIHYYKYAKEEEYFTEDEINLLKSTLSKSLRIVDSTGYIYVIPHSQKGYPGTSKNITIKDNNDNIFMDILKYKDDWFYVKDILLPERWSTDKNEIYVYYKCDQLEGLIKLIKDKQ